MTPTPPELLQLHDIHIPKPISAWALAPGWYVLACLLGCIALAVFLKIRHVRKHQRFKQQILQMLADLETEYARTSNGPKTCAAISELLRRIALICYPRTQVAGLQGEAWLAFLSQTSQGSLGAGEKAAIDFSPLRAALIEYPYQIEHPRQTEHPQQSTATCAQSQIEALFRAAKDWIQHQHLSQHLPHSHLSKDDLHAQVKRGKYV